MRLPTFYEQNLIPNWGNLCTKNSKKGYALVKGIPYFCTVKKFTTNEF